jgi:glycosyltransferase domain-containing protein
MATSGDLLGPSHDPVAAEDRVPFTHRWLAYAASAKLPHRILIADGGSDPTVAQTVAEKESQGLDLEYLRYPYDSTYADYYAKIADALSRVKTPFVVMADNDDFFVPGGLTRALEFLSTHPDHVACGGQSALFWVAGAGAPARADTRYGDAVAWKCSSQLSSDVAETAERRLRERCLGANDVFYAVHRTDLLRSHFEAVRDCCPHDLFLMEEVIMFLTAIAVRRASSIRSTSPASRTRREQRPRTGASATVRSYAGADLVRRFHPFRGLRVGSAVARRRNLYRRRTAHHCRVVQDVGGAVSPRRRAR